MAEKADERLTITVAQAARILGISRGLAYQMAREGTIPTLRFGRRIVVPWKAMECLLQKPGDANLRRSSNEEGGARRGQNSMGQLSAKDAGPERRLHLEN